MSIKAAYDRINHWMSDLPTIQFVLFGWLFVFAVSTLVGITFAGNSLAGSVTTATGATTGGMIVVYFVRHSRDR